MTSDTYMLIGISVAALLAVWVVFSLVKKVLGFVILAAVLVGIFLIWTNPDLQHQVLRWLTGLMARR